MEGREKERKGRQEEKDKGRDEGWREGMKTERKKAVNHCCQVTQKTPGDISRHGNSYTTPQNCNTHTYANICIPCINVVTDQPPTHTRARAHTHTHTRVHARTHTHTHTHTFQRGFESFPGDFMLHPDKRRIPPSFLSVSHTLSLSLIHLYTAVSLLLTLSL